MITKIVNRVRTIFSTHDERQLPATTSRINKRPRVIGVQRHKINRDLMSWEALRVCQSLHNRGFEAYIVGGAVRDMLLGVRPKDFDVVTNATPTQAKRAIRYAIIIGRRFRLVHAKFRNGTIIECSTFRALNGLNVQKDANGRVVSDNEFGRMWEDAARRDFTANALYYDPFTRQIFDYHHGYEDIAARRLRIIGNPRERYKEDPVRILRAIRIATKLGFRIDRSTKAPIRSTAHLLENVPHARLTDELIKILVSIRSKEALRLLDQWGVLERAWPDFVQLYRDEESSRLFKRALEASTARLQDGKNVSPVFTLASLLWPRVQKRWEEAMARDALWHPVRALHSVIHQVQLGPFWSSMQQAMLLDIRTVWLLQHRFEIRTPRMVETFLRMPLFRMAWDFLVLRSQRGMVRRSLVEWWSAYQQTEDLEERAQLLLQAKQEMRAHHQRLNRKAVSMGLPTKTFEQAQPQKRKSRRGKYSSNKSRKRFRHHSKKEAS